ncbi:MAG: hypothetical protein AB1403_08205 [Candidatus Riflebacteria bacterium]
MKNLFKIIFSLFLTFASVSVMAQLDPAAPPTDDLDYEEIQQRIDAMLPITPDLLKFLPICTFKFAPWPNGLVDSGARFQEAFKGYSLKADSNLITMLDKESRSIFAFNPVVGKQTLLASDFKEKNIQFSDFAQLRGNGLAIADNSRSALLFFKNNQLVRNVGFDGNRILFRHLDFIESDRLGMYLLCFDSGRNRTYVFDHDGNLKWEAEGRTEPCFYGNALIRLEKQDTSLQIQRLSEISRQPQTFATYKCQPGNIILDAWTAGTFGGKLAIVVYEGRGDEDNPDYARLLLVKDQAIETFRFRPNLDFRLSLQSPYRLLMTRSGLQLLTAKIAPTGIEILAAPIK